MSTPQERWCERTLKIRFKEPALLVQALTHRSALKNHNERLEFLGDAVLNFVIAQRLYETNEALTEGELSRARARLVNRDALATLANALALSKVIMVGPGEAQNGAFSRSSVLSDALEALLGAIYLDQGFETVVGVITSLWQESIHTVLTQAEQKDPKSALQEWAQSKALALPHYAQESMTDNGDSKTFVVRVTIVGVDGEGRASGTSLKRAESAAAQKLLALLTGRVE